MAQRSFTFVNRTGNPVVGNQEDEDLPTIRSHAMREVRRRKGLASASPPRAIVNLRPFKTATDTNRFRPKIHASEYLGTTISRAFSDPYHGTALGLEGLPPSVPRQLDYFVYGFTPLTFPTTHVQYECDILRIALNEGDPALLHALCAVSTIHQALTSGAMRPIKSLTAPSNKDELHRAFLYYKQCAIVLLQSNLSKYVYSQGKSSLATVALLLMIESLSGDTTTANAHKAGLLKLVKLSGGTQIPSRLLISDILMSEIKSATSSLSRPSIRLPDEWLSEFDILKHLPFVPHRPDLEALGKGFVAARVAQSLGPPLVLLMCAMRNLINALEHSFDMGTAVSNVNGTNFLVLEHQLLSLPSVGTTNDGSEKQMTECCRIGALLYCNLFLWSWPKNATLIENLLSRFRTVLLRWTREPHVDEKLHVFLWLYFVGSFAASNTEDLRWYLKGMEVVSERLDIQDEAHFRTVLASLFYINRLMGPHLNACYTKISSKLRQGG